MRKRFLSTLLALCMALTLLPGTAGAAEQRVIHVSTVDELKAELKSNTKIIMDDGNYNVGNGLYIQDIDNLTIQGGKKTRIVGSEYEIEDPDYNGVSDDMGASLFFSNCQNVTLSGLSIGHEFSFAGDSIRYRAIGAIWSELSIVDCNLFGGSWGIDINAGSIFADHTTIQNGYQYIMSLSGTESAVFKNCIFSDNGVESLVIPAIYGDSETPTTVTFSDCHFTNNKNGIFLQPQKEIYEQITWEVKNCTFQNNFWDDDTNSQPSKPVVEILDDLLKNSSATAEEITASLQNINKADLSNVIARNDEVFNKIEVLENRINGFAEIEIDSRLGILRHQVKIVGAKLNRDYSTEVKLQVGRPEDGGIQLPAHTSDIFRFSLKLLEEEHSSIAELNIPVKITFPIPGLTTQPQNFTLWHHHNGDLVPITLFQEPSKGADGSWYISFKTEEFGDFIMTYDKENVATTIPAVPGWSTASRTVTISSVTGGTVATTTRFPYPNAWVTLTVTHDSGYELTDLTVTNRYGQTVPVHPLEDGRYGFTMPDSDVTVNPVFTKPAGSPLPGAGFGSGGYADIIYPGPAMAFTDVRPGDWFHDSVNYVYTRRLMNGVSATAFDPQGTTSRAMIWTVLARLSGLDTTGGESWYERGRIWAMNRGITDGTAPQGDITREQLVTMLWRFKGGAQLPGDALAQFSDRSDLSPYAVTAAGWAVNAGLLKGDNGRLNPQGTATRAEAAAILQRLCQTAA